MHPDVRSMTGYGRGVAEQGGRRVSVEIRSVNHRFTDVKLRGAQLDAAVEEKIVGRVRERVTRGAMALTIRIEGGTAAATHRFDHDAARRAHAQLTELARAAGVEPRISLELLVAQPGVVAEVEGDRTSADLAEVACEAVDRAIEDLNSMRDAEGETLARDLAQRMERLGQLTADLDEQSKVAPEDAQRRLRDRLKRLLSGGSVAVDEGRLSQEVAVLADRMDVTEELVRVRSHIAQLSDLMSARVQAVGRRIDFLVQELGREYNTVASKSQSAPIARLVVEAKAELEKVREQVQNIE
ncbi:MAG TPA: YicC/YloC family endoribonuclease [Kofleriaceae bacterium]|nr:YicC/YloC family endoribonuclease [Kofleriaceae bacterium]